jgi:hypothetical protein
VDVVEFNKAQFLREEFSTQLYGGGNDGLLTRAVLWITQCISHHAAQKRGGH